LCSSPPDIRVIKSTSIIAEMSSSHGGELSRDRFLDMAPCNLVEVDHVSVLRTSSIISANVLIIEVVNTSETSE
jgi:hypothetical protein